MDGVFKYDCNLNIDCFIHMLDDPTECYKFYWFDSIIQLLAEKEECITFDKVISGMIADACEYSCAVKPHVRSDGNRQAGTRKPLSANLLA